MSKIDSTFKEIQILRGMQRYLTIYEIDSADVLTSEAWEKAGAFGDWPIFTTRNHIGRARRIRCWRLPNSAHLPISRFWTSAAVPEIS